tara:strand:- start:3445 stop:3648 length:204 start_codon:yes stop_codon:yes gene_type:complete
VFLSFVFFGFSSNADIADGLVFGKSIQTWLIYTLIFLALTFLSFIWTWGSGFLRDIKSGKSIKQPWD